MKIDIGVVLCLSMISIEIWAPFQSSSSARTSQNVIASTKNLTLNPNSSVANPSISQQSIMPSQKLKLNAEGANKSTASGGAVKPILLTSKNEPAYISLTDANQPKKVELPYMTMQFKSQKKDPIYTELGENTNQKLFKPNRFTTPILTQEQQLRSLNNKAQNIKNEIEIITAQRTRLDSKNNPQWQIEIDAKQKDLEKTKQEIKNLEKLRKISQQEQTLIRERERLRNKLNTMNEGLTEDEITNAVIGATGERKALQDGIKQMTDQLKNIKNLDSKK